MDAKALIGRRIVNVSPIDGQFADMFGWDLGRNAKPPTTSLLIGLDDGTLLIPFQDDEGNAPGSLFRATGFEDGVLVLR